MNIAEWMMSLEIGLIYGIVAMGIYITFRIIDFPDLTCDGSFAIGCLTSAMMIQAEYSPIIALLTALFAGGLAGLVTGLLNTVMKVTQLLSGILVSFMLYSINLKITGGVPNIALIKQITLFTNHSALIILFSAVFISIFLCGSLFSTDFGLALRSIGQNKRLALNCGVNVSKMTLVALILSNGLIGFSGALFSQHQGFADISQGVGTIVIGLAAVMIGERLSSSKSMWIAFLTCILGSILYRIFIAIALHSEWLGLATEDLNLITGLMIIAVMLIPRNLFISRKRHALST